MLGNGNDGSYYVFHFSRTVWCQNKFMMSITYITFVHGMTVIILHSCPITKVAMETSLGGQIFRATVTEVPLANGMSYIT